MIKNFKPNLIPNNPKDGSFDLEKTINKNGGMSKYLVNKKKDGVRLHLIDGQVLSRSLKAPGSKKVVEIYQPFADMCKELNIALDGEFYMHGVKFNAIFRFFSKSDVTTPEYKQQLEKEFTKNPEKFKKDYDGLDIDFLTTWHPDLKLYIFDGIVLDRPEVIGYRDRMSIIHNRVLKYFEEKGILWGFMDCIGFCNSFRLKDFAHLQELYEDCLQDGYEGLVLTHENHVYKYGRNSLNEGTLLKMKDDSIEFDGVVLSVEGGTVVKEGVEKTVNELGRSVTSKKKDDREESGIAKGFVTEYFNDNGESLGTFIVSLKGFTNEERKEIYNYPHRYIGSHFTYTGMNAVKDFPRHAYFKNWRDEK